MNNPSGGTPDTRSVERLIPGNLLTNPCQNFKSLYAEQWSGQTSLIRLFFTVHEGVRWRIDPSSCSTLGGGSNIRKGVPRARGWYVQKEA